MGSIYEGVAPEGGRNRLRCRAADVFAIGGLARMTSTHGLVTETVSAIRGTMKSWSHSCFTPSERPGGQRDQWCIEGAAWNRSRIS